MAYSAAHLDEEWGSRTLKPEVVLMIGLDDLRTGGILTDVTLVVDGKKLKPCHRAVLAAASPYFRAMFTYDVREKHEQEVVIKELSFATVEALVNYIYTGKSNLNESNVQDIMLGSSLLQIPGLFGECRRFMQNALNVTNCVEVYSFAKCLACKNLQEEAFSMLSRRIKDVVVRDAFYNLPKDDLIDILSSDKLHVDKEEVIYEASLAWVCYDIESRGSLMAEVLSYVRMGLLKEQFLVECILEEPFIISYEQLKRQAEASLEYIKSKRDTPSTDNSKVDKTESSLLTFYDVTIGNTTLQMPLNTRLRTGMMMRDMLLFSSGNKTFVYDPAVNLYYGEYECRKDRPTAAVVDKKKETEDEDDDMPEMKNAELYTMSDGTVYLIGGLELTRGEQQNNISSRVFLFDPEKLSWHPRTSLKEPRCMSGLGEIKNNLYVTGGKSLAHDKVLSTTHIYDNVNNEWRQGVPLPQALYGHCCTSAQDRIYILGGKTQDKKIISDVHCFDEVSQQWTQLLSMQCPRFLANATTLVKTCPRSGRTLEQHIYVAGGISQEGVLSSMESRKIGTENRWRFESDFLSNRCALYLTTLDGVLSAVGGHVTERNENGVYESHSKHDIHQLLANSVCPSLDKNWIQTTRRIRGLLGNPFYACTRLRYDPDRIGVL